MHLNQDGFSLTELLLSIVISSIILGAAFGSYAIINRNFEYQNDMRHISQTARMVVDIINKDIRMAGYKDPAAANIASTDAISIAECPGGTGCSQQTGSLDQITVIYDKSPTVRHKIRYYATAYPSGTTSTDRYRLMKRLDTCNPSASACSSDANFTNQYDEPIADYIEELTFTGSNSGCSTNDRMTDLCSSKGWITPSDYITTQSGINFASSCPTDLSAGFDNNPNTRLVCEGEDWSIGVRFDNLVKITKVKVSSAAHLDASGSPHSGVFASFNDLCVYDDQGQKSLPFQTSTVTHPYGIENNPCLRAQMGWIELSSGQSTWGTFYKAQCVDDAPSCSFSSNKMTYVNISGINKECNTDNSTPNCRSHNSPSDTDFDKVAGNVLYMNIDGSYLCDYADPSLKCILTPTTNLNRRHNIGDISFYGNTYSDEIKIIELETSVLIRSPNEHGNVDRSNGFNSKTDRLLRDKFIGSTVIRNLHYQSS